MPAFYDSVTRERARETLRRYVLNHTRVCFSRSPRKEVGVSSTDIYSRGPAECGIWLCEASQSLDRPSRYDTVQIGSTTYELVALEVGAHTVEVNLGLTGYKRRRIPKLIVQGLPARRRRSDQPNTWWVASNLFSDYEGWIRTVAFFQIVCGFETPSYLNSLIAIEIIKWSLPAEAIQELQVSR